MVVLKILILLIQECGISFPLIMSSSISTTSFSEYRSFASLGNFIPTSFILFDQVFVVCSVGIFFFFLSFFLVFESECLVKAAATVVIKSVKVAKY